MSKHKKKGLMLLAMNLAIFLAAYFMFKARVFGLLPGMVMMAEFFIILMVAVRFFVYREDETVESTLNDFAKNISNASVDGLHNKRKK